MSQRSIRIALPHELYERLKEECLEHGDLSRLVRALLEKHLEKLDEVEK